MCTPVHALPQLNTYFFYVLVCLNGMYIMHLISIKETLIETKICICFKNTTSEKKNSNKYHSSFISPIIFFNNTTLIFVPKPFFNSLTELKISIAKTSN